MGVLGTYCFDGINFSQASSLYTNSTLTVLAADGYYSQGGVVRHQLNGVLLNTQSCGTCFVPCGSGLSVSQSQNGFFDVNFDVANTTGAIVVYFYMGGSIADGVIANYNSTNYNRLTARGNDGTTLVDGSGTNVDYAGIGNQGTGDPTYVGSDTTNIIRTYTNTNTTPGVCVIGDAPENYSYSGSSYVAQGTLNPLTVTNSMCGRALTGSPVFTMVVPKVGASPTSVNLKVSAPYCGTYFRYELDCPVDLPSFPSSIIQSTISCNSTQGETYYFVRNAQGTSSAFTIDTNTIPDVGNFVFTDVNGATYLNDASTIKYYVTGTTALGVRNGVVVSSAACAGGGTNNSPFFATAGTTTLNDGTCGNATGSLLYHDGTGTLPQVADTIYAGSTTGSQTVSWSNYRGMGPADVADGVVDTAIVNSSGVIQTIYSCP